MKIKYFQDTETLYIEFRALEVAETKDLDERTLSSNLDRSGNICGITIEDAAARTDIPNFSYEQITAYPSRLQQTVASGLAIPSSHCSSGGC